jgi:diaminohydroxyphosphoribosylaminopyrimidine deaminase/5-amino-6-(5-phosphoribosylamino)uracil reductase
MSDRLSDKQLLQRAHDLARAGVGLASPNPYVGAVITDAEGLIAGSGTYTYGGLKHAEILALEAAGARARGGTLYINLEPHAHRGRTPPCTDALIAAGVRRVVASMADPNPRVSGRGFEQLRAAGVEVEVGSLEQDAKRLNQGFARYIRHGVPLVTLKSAMTLDGKIGPEEEAKPERTWITGEAARAHVQELRHEHDAILVGVGTILADDPLLTDRSGGARRRPLLRVILDSRLRIPLESQLVQSAKDDPKDDLLVFYSVPDAAKKTQLEKLGIRVERVSAEAKQQRPDINAVLRRLGELEIASVMIEGGSLVNASALSAGIVDKIFFYYAPTILGEGSISLINNAHVAGVIQPWQIKNARLHRFAEDFAIEGYLRDPYAE